MPREMRGALAALPEDGGVEITVMLATPVRRRDAGKPKETGGKAAPCVSPRIPRVTRLMALAIKFQDMVDRGEARDYADLARLGYVTRARLTQIMNLLLLAPDIQESLLHGVSETSISERNIRIATTQADWSAQRALLASLLEV